MNFFRHFRIISLILLSPLCISLSFAQLSAPKVEAVYGGRISAITGIRLSADTSRIFITTESANSAFYADIYHASSGPSVAGAFQVVAGMDDASGLGSGIRDIAAHATSRNLFFSHMGKLYRTDPLFPVIYGVDSFGINTLLIREDHLFYIKGAELHYGTIDASGNFSKSPNSPVMLPPGPGLMQPQLSIDPISGKLYAMGRGTTPNLFVSTEPFDAFLSTTLLTNISPASLAGVVEWSSMGIAPDGRIFLAGSDFMQKYFAWSDNDTLWTQYGSGTGGASGQNLSFGGDSANYSVYYASNYNTNKGLAGSWQSFGFAGFETHPNDGAVYGDPVNKEMVYMTTDMGIGASDNRGAKIFEINDGVEAVQVSDFDMTADKQTAWLSSKAGIRKVSKYRTSPTWTKAIFPNMDGSPYYAVAMAGEDTNTVYACNLRVYKSKDSGKNWQRQFSAEDAPYNFPGAGNFSTGAAYINSIEVCPFDTSIVMAGYSIEWGNPGGLFYSMDGGNTWKQQLIHASAIGFDVNVNDVLFSLEGSDTVAYIGVSYNLASPGGYSVYKLTKNGANWTVSQDMGPSGTSTGSVIVVSIADLDKSPTGDTLIACGTDAGTNHPTVYYKDIKGTNVWTPFTTSGFPSFPGKIAKAATYGIDTVYVAVDEEIYYFPVSGSAWTLGYKYPTGTRVEFLYYDELLVGTGTGVYGHTGTPTNSTGIFGSEKTGTPKIVSLYPNPADQFPVKLTLATYSTSPVMVKVYTLEGRLAGKIQFQPGDTFELPEELFPQSGLLLLEVSGSFGKTYERVVIKK
ncbi:MAG: T9SS type A sorting domain-containing protein [Bacteroidia bacterium]|nr:T9SS type A sorting domain-containing protein [Bacteroidia bacterium]